MNDEALADLQNSSFSRCSSSASESDLSAVSLLIDREVDSLNYRLCDSDELPAFEIRLISPHGRTPSPIDTEEQELTPPQHHHHHQQHQHNHQHPSDPTTTPCDMPKTPKNCSEALAHALYASADFVALHEINARITPPSDAQRSSAAPEAANNSLETIYEDVFLSTPPRPKRGVQLRRSARSRSALIEKVALNRLQGGGGGGSGHEKHSLLTLPDFLMGSGAGSAANNHRNKAGDG